jgi:hypothetical protein
MMAGARRLRASDPAAQESRDLLEQAERELREIEDEISRLLIRKRLVLILRRCLAAGRLHGTEV